MDISYYDRFSTVYDWFSPKLYYHKARQFAIEQLDLADNKTVLNVPIGTGQNLEYFQQYLNGSGSIIGIDLSEGMLKRAKGKISKNNWDNVTLHLASANEINEDWLKQTFSKDICVDAIFVDLGLSGFPKWQTVIDNLLDILKPTGTIVIMDWYISKPTLRGRFIKWIGKGEVNRPIYQYFKTRVANFSVDTSFNRGGVFVATGIKKQT